MQNWHKRQSNSCQVKWNPKSQLQLPVLIQNAFWGKSLLSGTLGNPHLNTAGMCTMVSVIHTSASLTHKMHLSEERMRKVADEITSCCISWENRWTGLYTTWVLIYIQHSIYTMSPREVGGHLVFLYKVLSLALMYVLSCHTVTH